MTAPPAALGFGYVAGEVAKVGAGWLAPRLYLTVATVAAPPLSFPTPPPPVGTAPSRSPSGLLAQASPLGQAGSRSPLRESATAASAASATAAALAALPPRPPNAEAVLGHELVLLRWLPVAHPPPTATASSTTAIAAIADTASAGQLRRRDALPSVFHALRAAAAAHQLAAACLERADATSHSTGDTGDEDNADEDNDAVVAATVVAVELPLFKSSVGSHSGGSAHHLSGDLSVGQGRGGGGLGPLVGFQTALLCSLAVVSSDHQGARPDLTDSTGSSAAGLTCTPVAVWTPADAAPHSSSSPSSATPAEASAAGAGGAFLSHARPSRPPLRLLLTTAVPDGTALGLAGAWAGGLGRAAAAACGVEVAVVLPRPPASIEDDGDVTAAAFAAALGSHHDLGTALAWAAGSLRRQHDEHQQHHRPSRDATPAAFARGALKIERHEDAANEQDRKRART
jgi:hypothetical protein